MTLEPDTPMSRRPAPPRLLIGALVLIAVVVALVAATGVLAGDGDGAANGTSRPVAAKSSEAGGMAPLPKARPKLVQPVAGRSSATAADALPADAGTASADDMTLPKVTGPATISPKGKVRSAGVTGLSSKKATALPNGVALPPLEAPEAVLNVIRAGNIIARSPYKWGGGHGRFKDSGYDCSGSVAYALYFAGLIDGPHTSGDLMAYGKPGKGRWITLYANGGHVWMEVAGIRFDTSGARTTGSRWQNELRNLGGYEIRHPAGL